jgi:hypothetical protein
MNQRFDIEDPEGKGCLVMAAWLILTAIAVIAIFIASFLIE